MKKARNKKLLRNIGLRIKQLRYEKDIPQSKFLYDTGIHIARIELGQNDISATTVSVFCKYFGITLEEFFSGVEY